MAIVLPGQATRRIHAAAWASGLLAAVLVTAGAIHLALMPEHLAKSTMLGLGFCAAGIAQLALATLVVVRPWRIVFAAVIAVSLVLMALYAYSVFIGLPFHEASAAVGAPAGAHAGDSHAAGEHQHDEAVRGHEQGGLILGAGEPVDALGAGTQAAEIAAVALGAYVLMRARTGADRQTSTP